MRGYLWVVFLFLGACSSEPASRGEESSAGPARLAPRARPNIVFFLSDDHAQQAIGVYGSRVNETPHIDRLARQGMIFAECFVGNSICAPARATVLTGLHSHRHGVMTNGNRFDGSQTTFPRLLQQAGYRTAVIGKWHLKTDPTGFDHWEVLPGQGHYYNPVFRTAEGRGQQQGYVTEIITEKAIDWLERLQTDDPFLLLVHHKAPHRAWEPGPSELAAFDGEPVPEPVTLFDEYSHRTAAASAQEMTIARHLRLGADLKVWNEAERARTPGAWRATYGRMNGEQRRIWDAAYAARIARHEKGDLTDEDLTRWKYQSYLEDYLACIAGVDRSVGRILDYLDEAGLAEDTIVIYMSDQGFYLGEHGWYDKRFMYEESLRTPLVMRWPGTIAKGSRVSEMVQNIDLAPTLLEIAQVEVPDSMQGVSLLPLLEGKSPAKWRDAIYYRYYEGEKATHKVYRHEGVRTERFKLIHYYSLGDGEWELFDLWSDPHELHSVADEPAFEPRVRDLKKRLVQLREQYDVPVEDP